MELSGLCTKFSHFKVLFWPLYGKNLRIRQEDKKRGRCEQHYVYYYPFGAGISF